MFGLLSHATRNAPYTPNAGAVESRMFSHLLYDLIASDTVWTYAHSLFCSTSSFASTLPSQVPNHLPPLPPLPPLQQPSFSLSLLLSFSLSLFFSFLPKSSSPSSLLSPILALHSCPSNDPINSVNNLVTTKPAFPHYVFPSLLDSAADLDGPPTNVNPLTSNLRQLDNLPSWSPQQEENSHTPFG